MRPHLLMALLGGPLLAGALLAADAPKAGTAEEEMKKLQGSLEDRFGGCRRKGNPRGGVQGRSSHF